MNDAATESLANSLTTGDRRALARAITLVESTRPVDRQQADALLERVMPKTGGARRLGLSGSPGAGKSTFIEALGSHLLDRDRKLAVLAVDPSSKISGGSILGDKTRMESLSRHPRAFIRPSPAGTSLGGVARRTREALLLCEAAGFDTIIVETVGVGQSETAVSAMTDMFLLLLAPAGGDELQGIKRGIVELADMILVNKADGDMATEATHAANEYRAALRLLRPATANWTVPVSTCSSIEGTGISDVWENIEKFFRVLGDENAIALRRAAQAIDWMWTEVDAMLGAALRADPDIAAKIPDLESQVRSGDLPATVAARTLVSGFIRK
ncbi:MAG: methylmalonyl Co-A mutase-associated GTPase MeaB [Alphaproteobacteria bacterium]